MRVVFDTNVFVSAFSLPGGQGDRAFAIARRREVSLLTSIPILTETAATLREKFGLGEDDVRDVLRMISRAAEIVKPRERIAVLDDSPDNRILECAVAGRADVIVSGDRHLLDLEAFRGVAIVRLVDFLRMCRQPILGGRFFEALLFTHSPPRRAEEAHCHVSNASATTSTHASRNITSTNGPGDAPARRVGDRRRTPAP